MLDFCMVRFALLTILGAVGAWGQTALVDLSLIGTGSGQGLPGEVSGHLSAATLLAAGEQDTTKIPLAEVNIVGRPTSTVIILVPSKNINDGLYYEDSSPVLSNQGRSGTAQLLQGGGDFAKASGTLSYQLTCTQTCFAGNGLPVSDIFLFSFSASGPLTLPEQIAEDIFPNIIPSPYLYENWSWPITAPTLMDSDGQVIVQLPAGIQPSSNDDDLRPAGRAVAEATSSSYSQPFTLVPPWQPVPSTYSAIATCPGLPACFATIPAPTGIEPPFTNTPIEVDLNLANLPTGVYQSNVALTVTPGGSTAPPSTENTLFTFVVGNGAVALNLSETGLQFQTVQAGPSLPPHAITVSSAGPAISYSATASTLSGGDWLSVTQGSGTASSSASSFFDANVNPAGLTPGSYFGRVDISAPSAATASQSVEVELTVAAAPAATLVNSLSGLIFVAAENTNPSPQSISVSTLSPTPISVVAQASGDNEATWLTVSGAAQMLQTTQPITETLSVNTKGLTPGVYNGTMYVGVQATGSDYPVTATLVVTPQVGTACTPTQLLPVLTSLAANFEYQTALPVPVAVQIVDDCGTPLNAGVVQASFSTGDPAVTMLPVRNGLWTGTWTPRGLAGGPASVGIGAQSAAGLQGGTSAAGTLDPNAMATVVTPGGILNAANPVLGAPLAPGEFVSIYGSNLAPSQASSGSYPLQTTLVGTQVLLGGQPLPLQFVSPGQINAVVPFGTPMNGTEQLLISQNGRYAPPETVVVATTAPAVFTQSENGRGAGVIEVYRSDGTVYETSPSNPASAGDSLALYCSGLGPVSPAVADGVAASTVTLSQTVNTVTATIGGQPAEVKFAGLAPDYAGVYQVNLIVPAGVAAGTAVPLVLSVGGVSSSPVTVTIQ